MPPYLGFSVVGAGAGVGVGVGVGAGFGAGAGVGAGVGVGDGVAGGFGPQEETNMAATIRRLVINQTALFFMYPLFLIDYENRRFAAWLRCMWIIGTYTYERVACP